jgi:hypothetical protein
MSVCRLAFPMKPFLIAASMLIASAGTSVAGLTKVYYDKGATGGPNGVDAKFENRGEWLQTEYGLNDIVTPNGTTSTTVLPQVERAVAQLAQNNANGLFLPGAGSGIPGQSYNITSGGTGEGVHTALTNFSPVAPVAGGTFANFTRLSRVVNFEFKRVGNVMSYSVSDLNGSRSWVSSAEDYFLEADALEFRLRTTSNHELELNELVFNDEITTNESLDALTSETGNTAALVLYEGVTGDFSLRGKFTYTQPPGNANPAWNHQIKALALSNLGGNNGGNNVVPEPASMAIFGALGGMLGWARLRRRNRA